MPEIPPNHPQTPSEARELVEKRRQTLLEGYESDNEVIQNLFHNYDRDVKRDLDTPAQVIPELLQNADDVKECETVEILISEDELVVRNDGRPLLEDEFEAICHIGQSTKQEPGYIGHFGRGFKSVFSVSDHPQIRSGFLRFGFKRDRCVLPLHLVDETAVDEIQYAPATEVRLPFTDLSEYDRSQLMGQIESLPRLMPYLRNVSKISVVDHGERTTYRREETARGALTEVEIYKNEILYERRHIFGIEEVPPEAEFSELVKHRALENEEEFRDEPVPIKISFPVDEDGNPISGDEPSRLFNFFPTETELDIPFDIQADFLLDSDRSSLHNTKSPYNQWIFGLVSAVYEKAVEYYLERDSPTTTFLELVPTRKTLDSHLKRIQEDILDVLREYECILGQDGEYHLPEQIIVPDSRLEGLLSESDVQELFGEATNYPADSLTQRWLNDLVGLGLLDELTIASLAQVEQDSNVYREKSTSELLRLAALFNELWEDTYRDKRSYNDERREFLSAVKQIPLVPLQTGAVVSSNDTDSDPVLPPDSGGDEYEIFTDRITLVDLTFDESYGNGQVEDHKAVAADARSFFENTLELSAVEDEYIITEVIAEAFKNPSAETDSTLDAFLEFVISDKHRRKVARKKNAIRLRVKSSSSDESVYKKSSELYLPKAYGLDYDLEILLEDIDSAQFVTSSYRELGNSLSPWSSFLTKAGVRDKLEVTEEGAKTRERFRDNDDLETELESCGDTSTNIPQAPRHLGVTHDTWLREYRYALSDYEISDTFEDLLDIIPEKGRESGAQAWELATMLASCWDYYEDRLNKKLYYTAQYGKGNPFRTKSQGTQCPSKFANRIRNTAWCPTKTGTISPPSVLLVEIPRTQGQPDGRYLNNDLPFSEANYNGLNISTRLDPSSVLKLLTQAPTVWSDGEPSEIRTAVNDQLDQFKAGLADCSDDEVERLLSELRNAPFLYVEAAETQFRTSTQVVLEGISLGDQFVSISTLYTRHHQFLRERVGVRRRVGIEDCLDFLAGHSGTEFTDEESKAWNQTLRELLNEFDELSEQEFRDLAVLRRLREEAVVPIYSGTSGPLTEIDFYCYDEGLLEATEQEIGHRVIQQPESQNLTQKRLIPLWEVLGLENLRAAVELDLADAATLEPADEWDRVVDDDRLRKLLTVSQSFLETSNGNRDDELNELTTLSRYHVEQHNELQGYYTLNTQKISERLPLQSYIDHTNTRILRATGAESYYDMATKLADELQLPLDQHRELRSLLSGAVGAESDFLEAYLDDHDITLVWFTDYSTEEVETATQEKETDTKTKPSGPELSESVTKSEPDEIAATANEPPERDSKTATVEGSEEANSSHGSVEASDPTSDSEPASVGPETTGQSPSMGSDTSSRSPVGDSSSGRRSTADSNSDSSEAISSSQESRDNHNSGARNTDPQSSTFESEVSPSSIGSQTALENKPDSRNRSQGEGSKYRRGTGSGGGGGGGGSAAWEAGLWGEEFVLTSLVNELRTALAEEQCTVTWFWDPTFLELPEHAHDSDGLESQSRLSIDRYGATVPGVEITGTDWTVRVLHIRDTSVGADILIEGADFRMSNEVNNLLAQIQPSENAEIWIEVKSSVGTMDGFNLTIPEYGRAREQQDDYCIVTVCQVGTPHVYIDQRFTNLAAMSDKGEITIQKNGELRIDY